MKKLSALLCIFLLIPLTACMMPENTEIRYRLVIEGIGVDYDSKNDIYEVTVQVLETANEEDSQSRTYTVKGETTAEAISSLTEATGKYPLYSQNRIIVLGSGVTGERMIKTLNFFVREYTSRPDVYVVSATGKASDILGIKTPGESTAKLIESEIEQTAENSRSADTELFNTVNLSLEKNTSFLLPLAEITDEYGKDKTVKITGSSAFSEDRLQLSSEETFFAILLTDEAKKGTFSISAENLRAALEIMKTDTKTKVSLKDSKPAFDIKISMTVDITEYESEKFTDLNAEDVAKIEKAAEEYITSGAEALVSRMLKDEKCDIFRMTQMFYRKYPSEYKNADDYINNFISESEVNISAEVKVGRIGQMTITR